MSEPTAYIVCRCGQCRVTLGDPNIRYRLNCLCCDCRQRLLIFAASSEEYTLPAPLMHYERGVDLVYFTNALIVADDARQLLSFERLREDAENVTAWSRCCSTYLCGVHPNYEGGSISVATDGSGLSIAPAMAPQFYLFASDFPADKYKRLPKLALPPVFNAYEEMEGKAMVAFNTAVRTSVPEEYEVAPYTTFEQLSAEQPIRFNNACYDQSRRQGDSPFN